MIVKVISLFLVFIAVLAVFGKLRFPNLKRGPIGKCSSCGRPKIGKGPCPCGRS